MISQPRNGTTFKKMYVNEGGALIKDPIIQKKKYAF